MCDLASELLYLITSMQEKPISFTWKVHAILLSIRENVHEQTCSSGDSSFLTGFTAPARKMSPVGYCRQTIYHQRAWDDVMELTK